MKRKSLSALLCLLMLGMTVVPAWAAEDNEGTVIVVDDWSAVSEPEADDEPYESDPFIPEEADKTVFGSDNRITVYQPSSYPFSAIAYMEVTGECGDTWTCTGFMVGKDRLLTAAHCLVCTKHSAWAKYINFYFGFKNYKNYLYCYRGAWTAWAGDLFSDRKYSINNDFGCVKFRQNVGDTVGWFGTWWDLPDNDVESKYMYVAGYRNGILRYDYGWVDAMDRSHLSYTMDTEPGNSGGPIFTTDYYAVGINIAGSDNKNSGFRLTREVMDRLNGLQ